jgi:hypothetical protein
MVLVVLLLSHERVGQASHGDSHHDDNRNYQELGVFDHGGLPTAQVEGFAAFLLVGGLMATRWSLFVFETIIVRLFRYRFHYLFGSIRLFGGS